MCMCVRVRCLFVICFVCCNVAVQAFTGEAFFSSRYYIKKFSEGAFLRSSLTGRRRNHPSRRNSFLAASQIPPPATGSSQDVTLNSRIQFIRASNLAGVVSAVDDEDCCCVSIPFDADIVCVTGETGSGKSLLVAKVTELLTGGKATASILGNMRSKGDVGTTGISSWVEMELALTREHLSAVRATLRRIGLDPSCLFNVSESQGWGRLRLRRTLFLNKPTSSPSKARRMRLRSLCEVNGYQVSLKNLAAIASPLLAVVDTATAATALSRPETRVAIIDTAVPSDCLTRVAKSKTTYRECRRRREALEGDLASRVLPASFEADSARDLELLTHWIDELDAFEVRVRQFCDRAVERGGGPESKLASLGTELATTEWGDSVASAPRAVFSSSMYSRLTGLRDSLRSLDDQIDAARHACSALSAVSSSESAVTALERARKSLFDAVRNEDPDSKVTASVERAHELLNTVETALSASARFLEDDDRGVLRTLETIRSTCHYSVEDVDSILLDWKTFARKHGISPLSLPSCHAALKAERDGNVEARTLLPKAVDAEEKALLAFEQACAQLTKERQVVAEKLSSSVSEKLASLGMEGSEFCAIVRAGVRSCSSVSAYSAASVLGLDAVNFLLLHGDTPGRKKGRGGNVHEIASAGEKTRLLLAIENSLPGSVGTSCGKSTPDVSTDGTDRFLPRLPPVAVIYDEIDAHVGGYAAVSMARMLVDQSSSSQVVAITHNPSIAALAELHIVIQKSSSIKVFSEEAASAVKASVVNGPERLKELARMASGDLAVQEAEVFAEALIRDGVKSRGSNL